MAILIPQEDPQTVNPPRAQVHGDETAFGGGPGVEAQNAQVQQIAQHTNEIATFEKIRADQTAVQGAAAQLAAVHAHLLTDPKDGLPSYQGINAMDGHDKILAEYQKQANELATSLQPDQQGAFNKIAVEQGEALNQHAMAYVNSQIEQHDTNTFQAAMKNNSQLAGINYGNPDAIATFKNQTDMIAGARAKRLGLDPDQTQDFMRTQQSNFHSSVLSQMVNDPKFQGKAEEYFTANKNQMTLADQETVQKWLGDGSIKSQSNQAVADLMQKHPNSESGFLAAADKIEDPDVRSMVRQIGSAQFAQNRAAKKNDQDQTFMNVQDQITKAGLTDPADIRQAIKTTDWENMSGAQRIAIQKTGQDIVTSPKMLLDYHEAVKDGSISGMSKADLNTKFLQYASLSDQKQILKTWAEGQKDTKNLAPTKTFHEMIDQAAVDAKIVSGPKASWDYDQLHSWKSLGDEVQQQIEATERTTGKKLSPVQQQELINKVVIDHTFTHKRIFSDDQVFVPFDQVPEDFILNARKEYPAATEDQIQKAFTVIKQGGKPNDARAVLRTQ